MQSKHTSALTALTLPADARLLVGHVDQAGRDDPQVPIVAREYRAPAAFADARCWQCPARSELSVDGGEALLLVVHGDGCRELAAIRAMVL
jgi:hypothetical protein